MIKRETIMEKNILEIGTFTRFAGLIGHPVEHTLSPYLQGRLAAHTGTDLAYFAFDVKEDELEKAIEGGRALSAFGYNVTAPYKKAVMKYLDGIDDDAKAIGAVNTVKYDNGKAYGYNTDVYGFMQTLITEGINIKGGNAVIIGAGGVSNAVIAGCLKLGAANILVVNRTKAKAEALIADFKDRAGDTRLYASSLDEDYIKIMDETGKQDKWTALHCTSLGMHPDEDGLAITDEEFYKRVSAGMDMIFNPSETRFMKCVKDAGGKAVNGLKMLIYQGVKSFNIWTGVKVSEETIKKLLEDMPGLLKG